MEEMQRRILDLIQERKKGNLNTAEIEKAMDIKTSSDFVAFSKTMDRMEAEGWIFRDSHGSFMTRQQKGIIEGKLSLNKKGTGYVDREPMPSVVIAPEDLNGAMDQDQVLVQTERFTENGKVVRVVKHMTKHLNGTYIRIGHRLVCSLDNERYANMDFKIKPDRTFKPVEGLKVLLLIEQYENPMTLRVERSIGHKDDPGVDILSILLEHDIVPEFPEEVMQEVSNIPDQVADEEIEGRVDLRKERIITIDGDDSKDFDDAVSVRRTDSGFDLLVCIADVAHYVKEGSALDKEALQRGCSTYVTDRVVPMLPHELSNGICSLNPHEDRLVNCCSMEISKEGEITGYKIYPAVMRSAERMTYHNVNGLIDHDPAITQKYPYLVSFIDDMHACGMAIRNHRHEKGSIDFESSEAEIKVDAQGHPISISKKEHGKAEEMIEDFMVAANVTVADHMDKHEYPCIYRVHEKPSSERLTDFSRSSSLMGHPFIVPKGDAEPTDIQKYLASCEGSEEYPVISRMMLRCMKKARYDAECLGHFGLAEKEYLHFTSPIRRYPDLIVHRMLRKYFYSKNADAKTLNRDAAKMQEYAEQSSVRELASTAAEWEAEDMKKAEYMLNHIGEKAEGIISSVTGFGFFVELPDTVEGRVHISALSDYYNFDQDRMELVGEHSGKTYRIGQKVEVEVLAAVKENGTIDFGIAEPYSSAPKKRFSDSSRGPRFSKDGGRENRYSRSNDQKKHKPSFKKNDSKSYSDRPKRNDSKPYSDRPKRNDSKPYSDRPKWNDSKSYSDRPKRNDSKPYSDRPKRNDSKPYSDRPKRNDSRPYSDRPKRNGGKSFSDRPKRNNGKPYVKKDRSK